MTARHNNMVSRLATESNRLTALKTLTLRFKIRPPIWRHIGKHPSQNDESLEKGNDVGNA